jgi:hypothetical protein
MYLQNWDVKLNDLVGKVAVSVTREEIDDNDGLLFHMEDGRTFALVHQQDCCEHVSIEDIAGDLQDLVGSPFTMAMSVSNEPGFEDGDDDGGSHTWTFFKLATVKGYVDVRFYGSSNGYYGESADFYEVEE